MQARYKKYIKIWGGKLKIVQGHANLDGIIIEPLSCRRYQAIISGREHDSGIFIPHR
jgi:hypothetical protein